MVVAPARQLVFLALAVLQKVETAALEKPTNAARVVLALRVERCATVLRLRLSMVRSVVLAANVLLVLLALTFRIVGLLCAALAVLVLPLVLPVPVPKCVVLMARYAAAVVNAPLQESFVIVPRLSA